MRAGEVDELARRERRRQTLARLLVEHVQPPSVIGACAQEVVHRQAPLRPPMPSEPSPRRRPRPRAPRPRPPRRARRCRRAGRGCPVGDLAPAGRAAQQELEVHAEVLELLAHGVAHDRRRFGVRLDGKALLVPADRLGLLGQRGAQAGERAGRGRQLLGRLVVLVEAHRISLVETAHCYASRAPGRGRAAPGTRFLLIVEHGFGRRRSRRLRSGSGSALCVPPPKGGAQTLCASCRELPCPSRRPRRRYASAPAAIGRVVMDDRMVQAEAAALRRPVPLFSPAARFMPGSQYFPTSLGLLRILHVDGRSRCKSEKPSRSAEA